MFTLPSAARRGSDASPPRRPRSWLRAALIGTALAATIPAPAQARSVLEIGILRSDGAVFTKHDGIGAPWAYEVGEAKSFALDDRGTVSFVRTDGAHFSKALGANWVALNQDAPNAKAIAGGGYLGVITANGQFRARASYLTGSPFQLTMQNGAVDASLSTNRVGVVLDNRQLFTKEGGLGASWVFQVNGALETHVTDTRIGARLDNGELWVKEGSQYAQWQLIASDATSFAIDGNRIAYINRSKQLFVKEGAVNAPWLFEVGGAVQGDLAGDVIGALLDNGEVWAKQGILGAPWQNVLQADGKAIDFSRYDVPDAPAPTPSPAADVTLARIRGAANDATALAIYNALPPAERAAVDARATALRTGETVLRDIASQQLYDYTDGQKRRLADTAVRSLYQTALGASTRATPGELATITSGSDLTKTSYDDPNIATQLGTNDWSLKDTDGISTYSANNEVQAIGTLLWKRHKGIFQSYRALGIFQDGSVIAKKPVKCITARIYWGWWTLDLSGNPGRGSESVLVGTSCTSNGLAGYPTAMGLKNFSKARGLLTDMRLEVCYRDSSTGTAKACDSQNAHFDYTTR